MMLALTLGLSEPLDCGTSHHGIQARSPREFTYNFVTNFVEESLEQARILLEILLAFTFPLGQADVIASGETVNKNVSKPVWNVHHPREQLHEMCSGGGGFGCAIIEGVNLLERLVIYCLEGGIVIQDGHGRGSSTSLKMLFSIFRFEQERGSQENCLLSENRMIVPHSRPGESFTCGTTSTAQPSDDENVLSLYPNLRKQSRLRTDPHMA